MDEGARRDIHVRMTSPSHAELASGTSANARAVAFTTMPSEFASWSGFDPLKSFTESFVFPSPALLNISLNFMIRSDDKHQLRSAVRFGWAHPC